MPSRAHHRANCAHGAHFRRGRDAQIVITAHQAVISTPVAIMCVTLVHWGSGRFSNPVGRHALQCPRLARHLSRRRSQRHSQRRAQHRARRRSRRQLRRHCQHPAQRGPQRPLRPPVQRRGQHPFQRCNPRNTRPQAQRRRVHLAHGDKARSARIVRPVVSADWKMLRHASPVWQAVRRLLELRNVNRARAVASRGPLPAQNVKLVIKARTRSGRGALAVSTARLANTKTKWATMSATRAPMTLTCGR